MKPINWNRPEDELDKSVWDRVTSNFWLPEKIPVSNDLKTWLKLTPEEQNVIKLVFAQLTVLDTLQSEKGVTQLYDFAFSQHEAAVLSNLQFMEAIHAKSYSTIFSTLCSMQEIDALFAWAETDELLQSQAAALLAAYSSESPYRRRAASVMLESMLFYTGFYAPLRMASEGKLTNTADIIRLILRDEGVHGFYIGYKAQKCNPTPQDEAWVYQFMNQLYKVEVERIRVIYDPVGWSTDVVKFLRYNANKALINLGLTPVFTDDQTSVSTAILSSLDIGTTETHDFFSGSGASYVIGKAEDTTDDDWSF